MKVDKDGMSYGSDYKYSKCDIYAQIEALYEKIKELEQADVELHKKINTNTQAIAGVVPEYDFFSGVNEVDVSVPD